MDLAAANLVAAFVSYAVAVSVAIWFLIPAARQRSVADALFMLLFIHAFRHVALQIFSAAEVGGLDASDGALRVIAFGDLATSVLVLIALWALRQRKSFARVLVWVSTLVGMVDLVSATVTGIGEQLTETATDFSWMILSFYVPALWVTAILTLWQLATRRSEPLDDRNMKGQLI